MFMSGLLFRTFAQFLFKTNFPERLGGLEILEGWGVYFSFKKWKFWRGGGSYLKFPPWWGYGYFLEPHNIHVCFPELNNKIIIATFMYSALYISTSCLYKDNCGLSPVDFNGTFTDFTAFWNTFCS